MKWSAEPGSNRQPASLEVAALPLSYRRSEIGAAVPLKGSEMPPTRRHGAPGRTYTCTFGFRGRRTFTRAPGTWIQSVVLKNFANFSDERNRGDRGKAHFVIRFVPTAVRDSMFLQFALDLGEASHIRNANEHKIRNALDARMLQSKMQNSVIGLNDLVLDWKIGADKNVEMGFRNLCHATILYRRPLRVKENQ